MSEVRLSGLTKSFDAIQAVKGIDLDIADHEFVVLVGPSGCGKSTTLRMIAGLEPITAGDLRIGADRVNDLSPGARDIAMVFQNYALYPHMTVAQNIAFGLRKRRMARGEIEAAVEEAARILELEGLLQRRPRALSGGQRQRVAMGRAIVRKPKVFLFDEPLSNLDAKLRVQMRLEIKRLHQRVPTTTVYVTHDQTEAMTMADRVVVMNGGVIEQVGTPMQIYRHPETRFVAGFIGSPAMNFFEVTLIEENARMRARLADGRTLSIPERRVAAYRPYLGQTLTMGLRPEAIGLASAQSRDTLAGATVSVVEPLGVETVTYFSLAGIETCARLRPDQAPVPGAMIDLALDMDAIILIDNRTDRVIAPEL